MRRLSAQAVTDQPLNAGTSEFKFDKQIISPAEEQQSLLSLDYDLDLDRDLVTAGDNGQLELWSNEGEGTFAKVAELQLDIVSG